MGGGRNGEAVRAASGRMPPSPAEGGGVAAARARVRSVTHSLSRAFVNPKSDCNLIWNRVGFKI